MADSSGTVAAGVVAAAVEVVVRVARLVVLMVGRMKVLEQSSYLQRGYRCCNRLGNTRRMYMLQQSSGYG